MTAFSPFGSNGGPLLKEEKIADIARKHGVSVGTVLLNYNSAWLISSFSSLYER